MIYRLKLALQIKECLNSPSNTSQQSSRDMKISEKHNTGSTQHFHHQNYNNYNNNHYNNNNNSSNNNINCNSSSQAESPKTNTATTASESQTYKKHKTCPNLNANHKKTPSSSSSMMSFRNHHNPKAASDGFAGHYVPQNRFLEAKKTLLHLLDSLNNSNTHIQDSAAQR